MSSLSLFNKLRACVALSGGAAAWLTEVPGGHFFLLILYSATIGDGLQEAEYRRLNVTKRKAEDGPFPRGPAGRHGSHDSSRGGRRGESVTLRLAVPFSKSSAALSSPRSSVTKPDCL